MGPVHPSLSLPIPLAVGITPTAAHVLSLLFASSYVGSIYLSAHLPPLRARKAANAPGIPPVIVTDSDGTLSPVPPASAVPSRSGSPAPGERDHPETIKSRIRAVSVATALSLFGVGYTVSTIAQFKSWTSVIRPTLRLLGIPTRLSTPTDLPTAILPYILAPTLLLGPIYATYIDAASHPPSRLSWCTRIKLAWQDFGLIPLRNYIVGPVTEELVFRSSVLAVSLLGHLSTRWMVFGTPMWFGLAHAHHAWESFRRGGSTRAAAISAAMACLFQIGYTTLFGWFASYLFLRTGSVLPPLASHVFCNIMGIYLPNTAVQRHPSHKLSIWAAYLAGIAGFIYGIRKL